MKTFLRKGRAYVTFSAEGFKVPRILPARQFHISVLEEVATLTLTLRPNSQEAIAGEARLHQDGFVSMSITDQHVLGGLQHFIRQYGVSLSRWVVALEAGGVVREFPCVSTMGRGKTVFTPVL